MKRVRSIVDYYQSPRLRRGTEHDVLDEDCTCYVLRNPSSSYWDDQFGTYTSRFKKCNFIEVERPQQEKAAMLHIAVRINSEDQTLEPGVIAKAIDSKWADGPHIHMMADVSADGIKAKIRARIQQCPFEQWLICSGNTIGEWAAPPVRFRSV